MTNTLDFLLSRRSRPVRSLTAPAPDRAALAPILTAALRVPDHGKLEPWRLIVLERAALDRLAAVADARGRTLGLEDDRIAKGADQFREAPMTVAVVFSPVASDKIPESEQLLSSACVALSLLNAALAAGWGACWLTGWPAYDATFGESALGLEPQERIVGFVHIGTQTATPPDRPRPEIDRKVRWIAE
ncbi:MAG: nitroreductase [Gemmobacter sp.]